MWVVAHLEVLNEVVLKVKSEIVFVELFVKG
jgi:hypothetical protein